MSKKNKKITKKKQGLILGIVAVVFVGLIAGVLLASRAGLFGGNTEEKADNIIVTEEQEVLVEGIEIEDGTLPMEEVMSQATGYDMIYDRLVGYHETMMSENSMYELPGEGDYLESTEDMEVYNEEFYDMTKVISFVPVPEYEMTSSNICKTDSSYAYLVRNDGYVRIMKLEGSTMEHMSLISEFIHEMEFVMDLHVVGDRLILITSYTEIIDETIGAYREGTIVYTYDITDRVYPTLMGSVELEGYYMGSRISDTTVYVYSNCYKDGFLTMDGSLISIDELEASAYVPSVNGVPVAAENVYVPASVNDSTYFTCMSVDVENPGEPKDVKSFLSVESQYYAGKESIYLTLRNGMYQIKDTMFVRVELADGMIAPAAAGAVEGYSLGEMSFNENDDQIRVITASSSEESKNNLYILDKNFQIISKKEDLAAGEVIQSVRFMNDTVFMTTYGENPIVAADMTDSTAVSEHAMSRIDGFEGLIYELGENRILGISYILNPQTLGYEGVRLSVFDAADQTNIQVLHTVDIKTDTTPVMGDATSLYLDVENGLIGFPTEDWDDTYTNVDNFYHLFSYNVENGFQKLMEVRLGAGTCWYARGFSMGDFFYITEQDSGNIRCFDMINGYSQTGEMYY